MVKWAAIVICCLHQVVFAATSGSVPYYQIYQPYVSPRALGMGNAFSAVADDYSTLFYNPAGLARLSEGNLNLSVTAAMDGKAQKFYNDVQDAMSGNDPINDLTTLISNNYGRHYFARATPLAAVYARPKWGIAIIPADLSVDLGIHQQVGPSLDVVAMNDSTVAFGLAKNLKKTGAHKVSIGMTTKAIYRAYYSQAVPAPQLAVDQQVLRQDLAQEGFTLDADLGLLWTPPTPQQGAFHFLKYMAPTLAAVVRNVGDYGFPWRTHYLSDTASSPPKLERRFDVGAKFELPTWWVFSPVLALDERDMGTRNYTFVKGSHVGLELSWKVRSWLHGGYRMGLSQGYWAGGVSAALGVFLLDFATWGEELGTSSAKSENRRYMLRASLDF